jgi:hypothetical protein
VSRRRLLHGVRHGRGGAVERCRNLGARRNCARHGPGRPRPRDAGSRRAGDRGGQLQPRDRRHLRGACRELPGAQQRPLWDRHRRHVARARQRRGAKRGVGNPEPRLRHRVRQHGERQRRPGDLRLGVVQPASPSSASGAVGGRRSRVRSRDTTGVDCGTRDAGRSCRFGVTPAPARDAAQESRPPDRSAARALACACGSERQQDDESKRREETPGARPHRNPKSRG